MLYKNYNMKAIIIIAIPHPRFCSVRTFGIQCLAAVVSMNASQQVLIDITVMHPQYYVYLSHPRRR